MNTRLGPSMEDKPDEARRFIANNEEVAVPRPRWMTTKPKPQGMDDRFIIKRPEWMGHDAGPECRPLPNDPVNHPSHYQSQGGIECIHAVRAALGKQGFVDYCRGAAIKYSWRAGKKALEAQDLRKGAWYLTKAAEALEQEENETCNTKEA